MMGWKDSANEVLEKHNCRVNDNVAGNRTGTSTQEAVFSFMNTLHHKGYKVQNVRNVGSRHVEVVVRYWYFDRKLKPSTLKQYISRLKIFFGWIGKGGMVKPLPAYLPEVDTKLLQVKYVAGESKSWASAGVDAATKIPEVDLRNRRLGLMLRLQLAFGLRRKEVVSVYPWKADRGDVFAVYPGEAKGGRPRHIPIQTEIQRQVLNLVKSEVKVKERLGWMTKTDGSPADLSYRLKRYSQLMREVGITLADSGVTGHSARAQYAENTALLHGFVPATLGGAKDQMSPDALLIRRLHVSEALGHSRDSVTAAYYGSHARSLNNPNHFTDALTSAVAVLTSKPEEIPPPEVLQDCFSIIGAALGQKIALTVPQAFTLWKVHSLRWGTEWIKPTTGIEAALEAAALSLVRLEEE